MMIALEDAVMEIIVNAGQSRSLCFEALHAARQGNRQPMTLIMVHAQDHLMNSLLARELSEEIIHLYQR